MKRYYTNTAATAQLTAAVTAQATVLNVTGFTGFPTSTPFTAIIDLNQSTQEVVLVTGLGAGSITVTRGYNGTAAVSHSTGATVDMVAAAIDFDEANGHVNSTSGVHGLNSAPVGVTDTQTLTNKTLTEPQLNRPDMASPVITSDGSSFPWRIQDQAQNNKVYVDDDFILRSAAPLPGFEWSSLSNGNTNSANSGTDIEQMAPGTTLTLTLPAAAKLKVHWSMMAHSATGSGHANTFRAHCRYQSGGTAPGIEGIHLGEGQGGFGDSQIDSSTSFALPLSLAAGTWTFNLTFEARGGVGYLNNDLQPASLIITLGQYT